MNVYIHVKLKQMLAFYHDNVSNRKRNNWFWRVSLNDGQENTDTDSVEEMISALKVLNRDNTGLIKVHNLWLMMTNLGEKLTDEKVEEMTPMGTGSSTIKVTTCILTASRSFLKIKTECYYATLCIKGKRKGCIILKFWKNKLTKRVQVRKIRNSIRVFEIREKKIRKFENKLEIQ